MAFARVALYRLRAFEERLGVKRACDRQMGKAQRAAI